MNAPLTTSAGRLFDAVSALAGVRLVVSYEGQAAVELETLAATATGAATPYPFALDGDIARGRRTEEGRRRLGRAHRPESSGVLSRRPFAWRRSWTPP